MKNIQDLTTINHSQIVGSRRVNDSFSKIIQVLGFSGSPEATVLANSCCNNR